MNVRGKKPAITSLSPRVRLWAHLPAHQRLF